jgi:peptide/nickel transport system permease protein
MRRYLLGRIAVAIPLVLGIATAVFLMIRLVPGDVVQVLLAEGNPSPEIVQARREALGLTRPLPEQYIIWMTGLLHADFGTSLATSRPVGGDLATYLPRTLELVILAVLTGAAIGIPAGIYAAMRRNAWADYLITTTSLFGLSVPNFVWGTALILVFGLFLRWFPTAGFVSFQEDPQRHVRLVVLPAVTLGLSLAAVITRMTRSALLEVLRQDYVRTALAKGLSHRAMQYRHALKNALIPVITLTGVEIGSLLGGTVLVEFVFNWPGLSTLLVNGAYKRDYPVVQAVVVVIAASFIAINLLVDIINAYLDPRIRYG